MVHTHCEELSLEQQLAGVRELCRHLGLVPAASQGNPDVAQGIRFTILNGLAKVGWGDWHCGLGSNIQGGAQACVCVCHM